MHYVESKDVVGYPNLLYIQGLDMRYSAIWLVLQQQDISSYPAQHELHLWIYYMSKFLNTSEFIIMTNSRRLTHNPNS
jgi:hypothetical protein